MFRSHFSQGGTLRILILRGRLKQIFLLSGWFLLTREKQLKLIGPWWVSDQPTVQGTPSLMLWSSSLLCKCFSLLLSVNMACWRHILYGQECEHKEIYLNNIFKIFQIFIKYFYSFLRSQLKYFSMLYTWLTCAIFRNIKLSIRFWRKKLYKCVYWLLLHIHLRKQ